MVEQGVKMEYKTIKIPEPVYNNIQTVRRELAMKGLEKLPKEFREMKICPACNSPMEGIEVQASYYHCTHCNYSQQSLDLNAAGAFAVGAAVGLGIAALLYLLTQEE